ncbi:hypothetical protein K523DRAFT_255234 [Schizophyllum commune Tattone D]|nr:hypothetical protein K523DRAFT_255234 [Schizophyllum commune Tattone D]
MPTSASTVFDVPEDAPEWITTNLAVINKPELGDKYCAAITAWLALEKKWKYDVNKGGSAKGTGRPEALERWIKAGRGSRVKKIPIVLDVPSFEAEVWAWWSSIQPEWRQMDADGRPSEDREAELDADWGLLGIHGQGGMLHAVAIACWWGVALEGRTSRSWERFVADVTWVCEEQVYA